MRIAVVGAGAAGLTAARELHRAGIEVGVFEAMERIGGRIDSRYDESGRFLFEAGAEWIDADHAEALRLCEEFGLELVSSAGDKRAVFWLDEMVPESELWPDARRAMERVWEEAAMLIASGREPDYEMSVGDFVGPLSDTPRAQMWVNAILQSDEGSFLGAISLAGWLNSIEPYLTRGDGAMSAFRVRHGLSKVMDGLAAELAGRIRLGTTVASIVERESSVEIREREGASHQFDGLVFTGSSKAAEQIVWEGASAKSIVGAYGTIGSGDALKLVVEFEGSWLDTQAHSGFWHLGSPLFQSWFPASDHPALIAYAPGTSAQFWRKIEEQRNQEAVESYIRRFFPGAPNIRDWRVYDLGSIPTINSAFSFVWRGESPLSRLRLRSQNGRFWFAGEGVAEYAGFVESAVRTGKEAARKVLCKYGR